MALDKNRHREHMSGQLREQPSSFSFAFVVDLFKRPLHDLLSRFLKDGKQLEHSEEFIQTLRIFDESFHPRKNSIAYPCCGYHEEVSLAFPQSRVIYVDYSQDPIKKLKHAGHEAYQKSVFDFEPPTDNKKVDIVLLFNPQLLSQQPADWVDENGYLLSNNYHDRATEMLKNQDFLLLGVIVRNSCDQQTIDRENPVEYLQEIGSDEQWLLVNPDSFNEAKQAVIDHGRKDQNILREFRSFIEKGKIMMGRVYIGEKDFPVIPKKKSCSVNDIFIFQRKNACAP